MSSSRSVSSMVAVSVLSLSLLLATAVLISLIPLEFEDLGVLKIIKSIGVFAADSLGSLLIRLEEHFWFYVPLGIIGIWRWSIWGMKRAFASRYKPIQGRFPPYDTSLSIITPVYNEDPKTFSVALQSWEINSPDEVIAVIDERDINCIETFKEFSNNKPWARLVVTSKPGKRAALADGIILAKSSIVALVDSDTVWNHDTKVKLLLPFLDPTIGGVTPRNHPIKRQSMWEKMTDIFWDMRNYYDLPSQAATGSMLTCLTGRTSLYRRDILLPKLDEFLNEILLGKRKESGEDKCLTRLVQKGGWKTYYQSTAVIYSVAASDFRTFVMQRLRWTRNSHNSDLASLSQRWAWRHPYLVFCMIDRFISTFTLFLGPIFLGISIYLHQWTIALAILTLWMVGRGLKILPHLKRHPEDIALVPVYVVVNFLIALIKLYALVTIRKQKWIRENLRSEVEKKELAPSIIQKIKDIVLTTEIVSSMVLLVFFVLR